MSNDSKLTHIAEDGAANMVDVGDKAETERQAVAEGYVKMAPQTLALIRKGDAKKGDVIGVARLAGIMGAKRTSDLIPLCHPLMLTKVSVEISEAPDLPGLRIEAMAELSGKTGVEMEALTAVSVACLTIYDMAKAADKSMEISGIRLLSKTGGKSGNWQRGGAGA
ncbi:cyclic pyranopterin monophosphate synthase MoaC [Hoeflea sp.]|uniref:cyclic pyranopterin monophosphate synthase MoaC n=1 Tax=Hoeflea sp. TaxID=1940281 RepID=UPI003B025C8C